MTFSNEDAEDWAQDNPVRKHVRKDQPNEEQEEQVDQSFARILFAIAVDQAALGQTASALLAGGSRRIGKLFILALRTETMG